MRIELYMICWNEAEILPFIITHYQKFCDKITVFDNYSDDNSREIAESMGCEVKFFGEPGHLNDQHYLDVKNNCWKGSTADYVIVCDCDEVLQTIIKESMGCPLELTYFAIKRGLDAGVTIFKTQGWQIISNEMPKENITDITNGWAFNNYSKAVIFDPKAIQEINYNPGAHRIAPTGNVVYSEETIYLLHYRQIGGVKRLINRYKQYCSRISELNHRKGYGIHYKKPMQKIISDWRKEMAISKPLF